MPGTNDFLPFAAGGAANVLTQAQYAALGSVLTNGFTSGTAVSQQLNKVWRQSSLMSAILGAFVADVTGQNVVDDGTTATILSNLMAAIMLAGYADDTGAVNAYAITLSPTPLAYYDGMRVGFSTVNANTTTNPTLNVNGLGAITITSSIGGALAVGQLPANTTFHLVYNSVGPRFELQSSNGFGITQPQFDNTTKEATTAFVQRALGNMQGTLSVSTTGTTTLTAAHAGMFVNLYAAGAVTVAMPQSSTAQPGSAILVSNYSAAVATVSPYAGDTLNNNNPLASVSIPINGWALFINQGGGVWRVAGGDAALPYSSLFSSSLSANGYQKLPSGLIIQWGSATSSSGGATSVTFPITFPGGVFKVIPSVFATGVAQMATVESEPNSSSFTFGIWNTSGTRVATSMQWIAIGY